MTRIEELGAGALELGSWLGNNIIPSMRGEGACEKGENVSQWPRLFKHQPDLVTDRNNHCLDAVP